MGYLLVNYKQSIDINKNNTRVSAIEPRDVIQVYASKIVRHQISERDPGQQAKQGCQRRVRPRCYQ